MKEKKFQPQRTQRTSRWNSLWTLCSLWLVLFSGCQKPSGVNPAMPPTVTTKSGVEMILIPAGSFQMGNARGQEDEKPVHTVSLDAFLMDKYEVT